MALAAAVVNMPLVGMVNKNRDAHASHLAQAAAVLSLVLVVAACSAGAGSPAASTIGAPASSGTGAPVATASAEALPSAAESSTEPGVSSPAPVVAAVAALAGTYRCLSRALYYDQGGGGTDTCALLTSLSLGADGRWSWETSSGSWHVRPVTGADWNAWGIEPYGGVSQVIVLDGLGQGPIEPASGFVWVVYHDASAAGTVWLKWGRTP